MPSAIMPERSCSIYMDADPHSRNVFSHPADVTAPFACAAFLRT